MEPRPKLLISACLFGQPVRFDGSARTLAQPQLMRWSNEGRLLAICPELSGGLPTPRPPAEIAAGRSGEDVLEGHGQIIEQTGRDVTDIYLAGAQIAASAAIQFGCTLALLTDGSPSCGSSEIADGSFSHVRRPGAGIFATLLRRSGIAVYSPAEFNSVVQRMDPPTLR